MGPRLNYVLVGLFVLVLVVAFIASVLWVGTAGPRRDFVRYLAYFEESVYGLSRDSPVTYLGVDVGRVADIGLDPDNPQRVRLVLDIDRGTPVKVDTVATLEMQGLTGILNVDLRRGSPAAPLLEARPGEPYPVIDTVPSLLARFEENISLLLANLIDTSNRLNALLDDENQAAIAASLENLRTMSEALAQRSEAIASVVEDLSATLENTREASAHLPDLVAGAERSAAALTRMADRFAEAGDTLQDTVESGGQQMERFLGDTLPEANAAIGELRQAAESIRRLSEALERDPGALLYGSPRVPRGPGE